MPQVLTDATTDADVIYVPGRTVLSLEGRGGPHGDAIRHGGETLTAVAHALREHRRAEAETDFAIAPLEIRWWSDKPLLFPDGPADSTWHWRLRIAVPAAVTDGELRAAIAAVGKPAVALREEAKRVCLERLPRMTCGRILHIGPWIDERQSLAKVRAALAARGLRGGTGFIEIELSDPRRTRAARRQTELLLEA